jgi:hypothetical protein
MDVGTGGGSSQGSAPFLDYWERSRLTKKEIYKILREEMKIMF